MARAKASRRGKCTIYFCNLEKRHFNEKIITKLIEENGEEIVDQFIILEKQKSFSENLYTSKNPILNNEHDKLL
jgi:hypothetical protein